MSQVEEQEPLFKSRSYQREEQYEICGAREMTQWLKVLSALQENPFQRFESLHHVADHDHQ